MTKLVKPYSQVVCYYLTTNFLPSLYAVFDPVFWGPDILGGLAGSHGMDWGITLLPSYLDADRNGKGPIQEFYNMKVVLRIIFDGLDVNSAGLVKQNKGHLESFFRPVFLCSIAQELFDYLGKNNE